MPKKLKTPLSESDVRALKLGETIYLDGVIYTGRDEVHIHALEGLEKGKRPPVEFKGSALFHCGPIMRKAGDKWEAVAAGPTTSSRMNSLEPQFIEKFRPGAILGKGGMSQPTVDAMKKFGSRLTRSSIRNSEKGNEAAFWALPVVFFLRFDFLVHRLIRLAAAQGSKWESAGCSSNECLLQGDHQAHIRMHQKRNGC